jgi:fumarate reductase subunit D
MIRAGLRRKGFVAAILHRLSGIALSLFLPFHFYVLALTLEGADALDGFLALTQSPFAKASEALLVTALSLHMALGLRVLAIEFLSFRERSASALSACVGVALAFGLGFLLNSN